LNGAEDNGIHSRYTNRRFLHVHFIDVCEYALNVNSLEESRRETELGMNQKIISLCKFLSIYPPQL